VLTEAVRAVCRGETWLSDDTRVLLDVAPHLQREQNAEDRVEPGLQERPAVRESLVSDLTKREMQVLVLLGVGKTDREIGLKLGISRRTGEYHVSNLLRKLSVSSRVEAAVLAPRLLGHRDVQETGKTS